MAFYIVDAFTDTPFGGNPAGVVLFDELSEEFMQQFARELGYSETGFVRKVEESVFHVRFFTPNSEVDLCGHATVASYKVLLEAGWVADGSTTTMKTGAGSISVTVRNGQVMMEQAAPRLGKEFKDHHFLARLLGIDSSYIGDADFPLIPQAVSTGLYDLMVPITSLPSLEAIRPDLKALAAFQEEHGLEGIHAFTLDTSNGLAISRNFSPLYGIDEEAATGTASGAMTYYLFKNGVVKDFHKDYRCLQGDSLQRPSIITTRIVNPEDPRIEVGGSAVIISKGILSI